MHNNNYLTANYSELSIKNSLHEICPCTLSNWGALASHFEGSHAVVNSLIIIPSGHNQLSVKNGEEGSEDLSS